MHGGLTGSGSSNDDRVQGASFGKTIGMRSGNKIDCNDASSVLNCRCNVDRKREIIDAQFRFTNESQKRFIASQQNRKSINSQSRKSVKFIFFIIAAITNQRALNKD